jgi:hypothetical protein
VAAAVTTAWAALLSLVPVVGIVLLVHLVDRSGAPVGRSLRLALAGWLLAHGTPISTDLGPIRLVPLLLTGFAVWRVARAGVHTTRAIGGRRSGSVRLTAVAVVGVAVSYGLLGALAAAATNSPGLRVSALRAGLTLGAIGLVAGFAGAGRESGVFRRLVAGTPILLRDAVRTGLTGAVLLLAGGAATAGVAVAVSGGRASEMLSAYHTGVAGQAGLTLLCLVYAPNLAVWASSYLVGTGFAFGAGTTVSVARVSLGALPAVPALAGLPSRPAGAWGSLLLGVPLAAGMAAGALLARRRPPTAGSSAWVQLLGAAVLAGPVAGAVLALAAFASGGPLGGGRLARIGPSVWTTAGIGAGLIAAGALVAAAATALLMGVRRRPS